MADDNGRRIGPDLLAHITRCRSTARAADTLHQLLRHPVILSALAQDMQLHACLKRCQETPPAVDLLSLLPTASSQTTLAALNLWQQSAVNLDDSYGAITDLVAQGNRDERAGVTDRDPDLIVDAL